jgi:methionyl-tRNA formyltransferase
MTNHKKPKIAIAGAVNSSKKTLEKLIEHQLDLQLILALNPMMNKNVSGYQDLKEVASNHGLKSDYFNNINDDEVIAKIKQKDIDYLFVVGLSQLITDKVLDSVHKSCIGYHPTLLPKGRGRATIAWCILGEAQPAVSFFKIDNGMDTGKIYFQKKISLSEDDYAQDLINKLMEGIDEGLDDFLPMLNKNKISPKQQNENDASYVEIRRPQDGYIDWNLPSKEIYKLIRATSKPLPGAFSIIDKTKIIIWRAEIDENLNIKGVSGRIIKVSKGIFWIQTADYPLKVTDYTVENQSSIKLGNKLGINPLSILKLLK